MTTPRLGPRRWRLLACALVLAALASATAVASSAGASAAVNLARARSEANRLLGLLHVPPGSVELGTEPRVGKHGVLGSPSYEEATPNLVDAHHWWRVQSSAAQVLSYVTAHLPRDAKPYVSEWGGPSPVYHMKSFALAPIPGVLSERVLAVSVVQLNRNTTAVRTDGETVWIVPRAASEKVPTGVHEIDIRSAYPGHAPIVAVRVTTPPQVNRIVNWINALPVAQPGTLSCPVLGGPNVTFAFRAAAGRIVSRASGMDFEGTSGECNAIDLSIRGRQQQPLIGGDFYERVQRLLGIRLE